MKTILTGAFLLTIAMSGSLYAKDCGSHKEETKTNTSSTESKEVNQKEDLKTNVVSSFKKYDRK